MSLLIENWCGRDGSVVKLLVELLEDHCRRNRDFVNSFDKKTRDLITGMLGKVHRLSPDEVIAAAAKSRGEWLEFAGDLSNTKANGEVLGRALVKGDEPARQRILSVVNRRNGKIVAGFFNEAMQTRTYTNLPTHVQIRLVESRHFKTNVDLRLIESLLQLPIAAQLRERLQEKYDGDLAPPPQEKNQGLR